MQCIFSILGQQGCLRTVFYESTMRAKFCKVIVKMWRWWGRYNTHQPQISLLPGSQTRAQTKSSDRRHLCSKHTMWNMCKALIARKNWPPFCHFANSCNAITIDNGDVEGDSSPTGTLHWSHARHSLHQMSDIIFRKWGWGSKAVWNFSENSSDLVAPPFPKGYHSLFP